MCLCWTPPSGNLCTRAVSVSRAMSITTNPVFKLFFCFFWMPYISQKLFYWWLVVRRWCSCCSGFLEITSKTIHPSDDRSTVAAEPRAIFFFFFWFCFVCLFVFCSAHLKESSFLVLSDSVPSLQAMLNKKFSHPILINIYDISGFDSRWDLNTLSEFLTMLATEAIRRQNTAVNDTIDADISIDR